MLSDFLLVLAGSSLFALNVMLKLGRHFPQIFHLVVYLVEMVVILFELLNSIVLVAHEEVNDALEAFPTEHRVELLAYVDGTLEV